MNKIKQCIVTYNARTVSGLLETTHRIPNPDYHTLMRLT